MALPEAQFQKFTEWLADHNVSQDCIACGTPQNFEAGVIIAGPVLSGKELLPKKVHPMVQLTCKNCKHIMLFAAKDMGLLDD